MSRTAVLLILTFLLPVSQTRAGDLENSIRRAVANEVSAQSSRSVFRSTNGYFVPGLATFAVGAPVVIYGALKTMEGACNGPEDAQVACGRGHYPAMVAVGAGLVAFGSFLMLKGGRTMTAPELTPRADGVALRSKVRW